MTVSLLVGAPFHCKWQKANELRQTKKRGFNKRVREPRQGGPPMDGQECVEPDTQKTGSYRLPSLTSGLWFHPFPFFFQIVVECYLDAIKCILFWVCNSGVPTDVTHHMTSIRWRFPSVQKFPLHLTRGSTSHSTLQTLISFLCPEVGFSGISYKYDRAVGRMIFPFLSSLEIASPFWVLVGNQWLVPFCYLVIWHHANKGQFVSLTLMDIWIISIPGLLMTQAATNPHRGSCVDTVRFSFLLSK